MFAHQRITLCQTAPKASRREDQECRNFTHMMMMGWILEMVPKQDPQPSSHFTRWDLCPLNFAEALLPRIGRLFPNRRPPPNHFYCHVSAMYSFDLVNYLLPSRGASCCGQNIMAGLIIKEESLSYRPQKATWSSLLWVPRIIEVGINSGLIVDHHKPTHRWWFVLL